MPAPLRIARTTLAVASLCLILAPIPAHAVQGMNLRWASCFGDGGVQNRSFACDSNTGVQAMQGSFVLASDMPQVIGTEIYLQLAADSPSLPEWWQFKNSGTCHQSALSAVFIVPASAVACSDWSGGSSVGGLAAYCTVDFPCFFAPAGSNAAFVKAVHAVAPELAADLTGGVEYYDFSLDIANIKTVGAGSCGGCTVPVCIVLNSINVVDKGDLHERFISTPTLPGSNYITWQGGGNPNVGGVIGCPAATPTRRSTWGSVKSLYR